MKVMIQIWQLWCSLVREINKGTLSLDILITFGLSGIYDLLQSFLDVFSQHSSSEKTIPFTQLFGASPKGTKLGIHRRAMDHWSISNVLITAFPKPLRHHICIPLSI
jgi:hypothetical protein